MTSFSTRSTPRSSSPPTPLLLSAASSIHLPSSPPSPTHPSVMIHSEDFYKHVQVISLEKLRMVDVGLKKGNEWGVAPPTPTADDVSHASLSLSSGCVRTGGENRSGDVRWRHLVTLSYQKAKICAKVLGGRSRRPSNAAVMRPGLIPGLEETSSLLRKVKSTLQFHREEEEGEGEKKKGEEKKEEEKEEGVKVVGRRTRSRSDAFMLRPGSWRPSATMLVGVPAVSPAL